MLSKPSRRKVLVGMSAGAALPAPLGPVGATLAKLAEPERQGVWVYPARGNRYLKELFRQCRRAAAETIARG